MTNERCPCVHPCAEAHINAAIMQQGESFRYKRGDVLWHQGDAADWMLVVCTGTLKLTREWPGGRDVILDLVHRGQLVGAGAALPQARYTSTCTALASGKGIRIDRPRLRTLLEHQPELGITLLELSHIRLQSFVDRLEEMAHGPVEQRLARVLLRIGDHVGLPDSRGTFVPVRLTRGDLAGMVGCRVETTIRVLTRWQREGVVETRREGLVIKDRQQLTQFMHPVA
ncbi:MAG: Crp/Fnr family transcriptional regulator [Deltaproteobacteria bacterium]|nr:Crp/Fnr family transcriptional regulator [Deltaproteobacteria bacterium]